MYQYKYIFTVVLRVQKMYLILFLFQIAYFNLHIIPSTITSKYLLPKYKTFSITQYLFQHLCQNIEDTTLPSEYSISNTTSISIEESSSSKSLEALPLVVAHEESTTATEQNQTREALSHNEDQEHDSVSFKLKAGAYYCYLRR